MTSAPPDLVAFRETLASRLQEVEAFAAEEVERLSRMVVSLQADNSMLKGNMVIPGIPGSVNTDALPIHSVGVGRNPNFEAKKSTNDMSMVSKQHSMIDVDRTKKWVKDELCSNPVYDVTAFYYQTGRFQELARNRIFENLTLAVIVVNAVWIAVDLDHNDAKSLLDAHPVFQAMEHSFCMFFTFEVFVRFMAFEKKSNVRKDGWFVFDSILVSMMIGETWIMTMVQLIRSASGGSGGSGLGNASVLRMLRLLRLTRMARMARMMRFIPELMIMIKGMGAGLRSGGITSVLVVVLTYLFAIMFKQLTLGSDLGDEFFPNVPRAAYNLLVQGVFPDNGDMMTQLGEEGVVLGFLFFFFLCLVALTFMNMLLGLLCDAIASVSDEEREINELARTREKVEEVLRSIDLNYDGVVSKQEFQAILENVQAIKALQNVDVDVFSLIDDADFIFDGCLKEKLGFDDFMEEVLSFRTNAAATIRVLAGLRKSVRLNFLQIGSRLSSIEQSLTSKVHGRKGPRAAG